MASRDSEGACARSLPEPDPEPDPEPPNVALFGLSKAGERFDMLRLLPECDENLNEVTRSDTRFAMTVKPMNTSSKTSMIKYASGVR